MTQYQDKNGVRYPSMLWHIMVQITLLCVLMACMFHWWRIRHWLIVNVWVSEFWAVLGYMIPCLVQTGFILFLEYSCRFRNKYLIKVDENDKQ